MLNHKRAKLVALLRSGRTINIGGRPVLAPTSRKSAADRRRAYSIQLALAFAATYLIGVRPTSPSVTRSRPFHRSLLQASGTHNRWHDSSGMGLGARLSSGRARIGVSGIHRRSIIFSRRSRIAALGRTICGVRTGRAAHLQLNLCSFWF